MRLKLLLCLTTILSYFLFLHPSALFAASTPRCTVAKPSSAPYLVSAVSGDKIVTLTWIEAQDPVTHYVLAYGTAPDYLQYGNPNIGGKGTTTYTVRELTNNTKYYFRIRAVNDCKPGKFSNSISATPGTKDIITKLPNLSMYKPVLGASTSAGIGKIAVSKKAVLGKTTVPCTTVCISWQLLTGEAFFLLLYFFLAGKFTFLKPIGALSIPIVAYILFTTLNGSCRLSHFSCKYFLPLSIVIFALIVVFQKKRFLQHKLHNFEKNL